MNISRAADATQARQSATIHELGRYKQTSSFCSQIRTVKMIELQSEKRGCQKSETVAVTRSHLRATRRSGCKKLDKIRPSRKRNPY